MIPGDHIPSFFPVESMFQNTDDSRLPSTTLPLVPGVAQDFHGDSSGMVMRRTVSFSGFDLSDQEMHLEDEMSEDGGALGEKKRRLSLEQVKALEKSFELGNKLEPERKMQLARALGLKPKQVGIWFQNRRARWKTKQMEKDFQELKKQLELLKADNEALRTQNKQFQSELMVLRSRESSGLGPINLNKENEASWSNGSEGSVEVNPGITGTRHVFPSGMEHPGLTHLFEGSGHQQQPTSDGGLSNMLNGVEEQSSFWAWPEHPNFR